MKKGLKKFTKILVLIAMIFSDLASPISVLADVINTPTKGDVGINNSVTNDGNSTTVSTGSTENEGGVKVTKTVSKTETEGRYKIDFKIEGKDVKTSTSVTKPVYVVVVFDRSGSMICDVKQDGYSYVTKRNPHFTAADGTGIVCKDSWDNRNDDSLIENKWKNAVNGAISFSNSLASLENTNVSLVTFSGSASTATEFKHASLEAKDFGHPEGSTNLTEGISNAIAKLDTVTEENAQKYIVVIGDGEPTVGGSPISKAYEAKNEKGINIFAIGYGIEKNTNAQTVLKNISSNTKITKRTYGYGRIEYQYTYEDKGFYKEASSEGISSSFQTIFEEISTANAATNAVLTDNIGGKFTLTTDKTSRSYVSEPIANITEEGTTLSFFIEIDKDSETGWHNTNEGFELKYTDANGKEQILKGEENPQVYWVQNTYDYIVNYYKDSFNDNNKIASETRKAPNGTVINESNVERDKYLPEGYEFNTIDPTSITITNDGTVKEINILYTIKKFNYVVNYYYDDVLDKTISKENIPYETSVDAKEYYLNENEIKEGYSLDTVKSDNGTYTITDNNVIINIYYKKNNYKYSVNYFFNNEKGFTNNSDAIYGDKITARSKWLSNEELNNNGKNDYFLDPSRETENNSEITIGTDSSKNVLDIYYINTNFDNTTETISKVANTTKVSSSNDIVSYTVNYNTKINNVRNGDIVKVTMVDTLPGSIIESDSNLNGGVYDSENNTITWTKIYNITEYQSTYNVNEKIDYTVKYENYLNSNGNKLINTVYGNTTVSHENLEDKVTLGKEDTASVPVEINGTVNVYFKDEKGTDIASKEELGKKLAGTPYETTAKNITGYTLKEEPSNKNGNYIEGNIDVIYYYTKNDGDITENNLVKEGTVSVSNINDTFNYTLKYNGKVEKYVGKATLTITDTLPLEGTIVSKDNRCTFENNTITCTKEYTVNGTLEINEEFNFKVKYSNITEEKIVNEATSKLTLENKEVENKDETETKVYKGTVVATYKDTNGNTLSSNVETSALAGTNYTTETKYFYGYTLKEVPSNKEGIYAANETIYVEYIYTKNIGTSEEELHKNGLELVGSINDAFDYTITYNTEINDYVGKATLTITDVLPYEIDIEKSEISNNCTYNKKNNTIICKYEVDNTIVKSDITNSVNNEIVENRNIIFNIEENFKLFYINVDKKEVTNKVTAELTYGNITKTTDDEYTTEVEESTIIVNYVTKDGEKLTDSITLTGLVGTTYETIKKEFDKYSFIEVKGKVEGTFTKEQQEVTYVYDLTILPPQTGVETNIFAMYINYIFAIIALALAVKTYKTIKNN